MKAFNELGPAGRTARLGGMAVSALRQYEVDVATIQPLATHFNAIFRIDTAGGERFALRINRPGHRTLADIRSELLWLDALRRETDLTVAEPVPARDGGLVVTVETAGVPEPRHAALFRWVEGRNQIRTPSRGTLEAMGRALATMHDHADRFTPPPDFTERALDRVWPHGVPAAIATDRADERFSAEALAVLRAAAGRVEAALARLAADPGGRRFLHADLHLGNVKRTAGGLAVLDFDDSLWCHPAQDAGISLFYLQGYSTEAELAAAFRRGYERVRPWPEPAVETFAVARMLELVSAMGATEDPGLAAYLPRVLQRGVPRLRAWLERDGG